MIEAPASKSFAETGRRSRANRRENSPLLWLNLVCLDAPIVAVTWEALFARTLGLAVPRGATAALFLTAWLIYLADRFGDSLSINPAGPTSLRQRFCLQRRVAWLAAILLVAAADLLVILRTVDSHVFRAGAVVGIFAFVYLVLNQTRPTLWQRWPLKEISIGFLFAAGAVVPIASGLTSASIPGWLIFALICSLNCVCIAVWERELDRQQGRVSVATAFPKIQLRLLPVLVALGLLACVLAVSSAPSRSLHGCLAASAGLLATVHGLRNKFQSDIRTALADLVLLTPLIFLV